MTKQITKHKSRRFRRFLKANEAVSALEYAILVGVVAVGIAAAIFGLRNEITTQIGEMKDAVADAGEKATKSKKKN